MIQNPKTLRLRRNSFAADSTREDYLFVALRCEQPLAPLSRCRIEDVTEVMIGRGLWRIAREYTAGACRLRISIPDPFMSKVHATLRRDAGDFILHDTGSSNGTIVNGTARCEVRLQDGDSIQVGSTFLIYRRLPGNAADIEMDPTDTDPCSVPTLLPALERDLAQLVQIAATSLPVVILGETGTGKELVARAVHDMSKRGGDFVAFNCGALPSTLLEAELFGYRKGAFSGATEDRSGLVRASHAGTLLLDEVGDLPATAQTALLRVLQEREVLPLGCTRPIPVDLRIVCATHRNLSQLAARGEFRPDLLARISGYALRLPPLRDRREDVGLLVARLLVRLAGSRAATLKLAPEVGRQLLCADWPLNVRELEQSLGVALAFASEHITLEHFACEHLPAPARHASPSPVRVLSAKDREHYLEFMSVLKRHSGNISATARELGKERIQVRRLIKRYGVDLHDLT